MKKIGKYTLIFLSLILVLLSFYIIDGKIIDSKLSRFAYSAVFPKMGTQSHEEFINFSKVIPLDYFSSEYKSKISKEEYSKISSIYEAKEQFDNIPVKLNINHLNSYRYINSDNFKTPIGNSYITEDKAEIIVFHVIIGIEKYRPVIKKLTVSIKPMK